MSFSLFINNLAEKKIRTHLQDTGESVPNQKGNPSKIPTISWIRDLMRHVARVNFKIGNIIHEEINGLRETQKIIVRAFGKYAKSIYGFP